MALQKSLSFFRSSVVSLGLEAYGCVGLSSEPVVLPLSVLVLRSDSANLLKSAPKLMQTDSGCGCHFGGHGGSNKFCICRRCLMSSISWVYFYPRYLYSVFVKIINLSDTGSGF
jgi:hypothetical protein